MFAKDYNMKKTERSETGSLSLRYTSAVIPNTLSFLAPYRAESHDFVLQMEELRHTAASLLLRSRNEEQQKLGQATVQLCRSQQLPASTQP